MQLTSEEVDFDAVELKTELQEGVDDDLVLGDSGVGRFARDIDGFISRWDFMTDARLMLDFSCRVMKNKRPYKNFKRGDLLRGADGVATLTVFFVTAVSVIFLERMLIIMT